MADLGDSPTLNPAQGYGDAGVTNIPKTLGFDQRWLPILQLLMQQRQAGYNPNAPTPDDTDIGIYNDKSQPMWKRVGLQAPPLTGPQQSYAMASNLRGSGDGSSGQAGRMESSYNNSPYQPQPSQQPTGTVSNTGAPQANSQAELAGQGSRGWNIYQTTPTWTGSPLSQAPEARDEGDFKAPPISGPQNPLVARQMALRQQILQQAMANIPRGYHFKLG